MSLALAGNPSPPAPVSISPAMFRAELAPRRLKAPFEDLAQTLDVFEAGVVRSRRVRQVFFKELFDSMRLRTQVRLVAGPARHDCR
jgi:hypothetical protein